MSVSELALSARTVEDLVRACDAGSQPKYLHFWGHTAHGPEVGPQVLSQWFPTTFEDVDGRTFRRDHIWGIGVTADSEHAATPTEWRGLNLLGFALMQARSRLQ